jgi:hypothetical protein
MDIDEWYTEHKEELEILYPIFLKITREHGFEMKESPNTFNEYVIMMYNESINAI